MMIRTTITYGPLQRGSARRFLTMLLAVCLYGALTACTEHDGPSPDDEKSVDVKLTFALPQRIVGTLDPKDTRMTGEVVQESEDAAGFRGIDDVHMFCFGTYPTASSRKLGEIIEINSLANDAIHRDSEEDYTVNHNVSIPVGTTHFTFYARASDAPSTHEERMHYGTMEAVGLRRGEYNGNDGIRFRPVPICTSTASQGGSAKGQALLALLNELVNVTSSEPASENRWPTTRNANLQEAFRVLSTLTNASSFNVQYVLGLIYPLLEASPGQPGYELGQLLMQTIDAHCAVPYDPATERLTLADDCQGFPADLHLPEGAARLMWDDATQRFVQPDIQNYGRGMGINAMTDYVYPMNLQYQVVSELVASDSLVLTQSLIDDIHNADGSPTTPTTPTTPSDSESSYKGWQQLLDSLYQQASPKVTFTTRSVAMVRQIQYAVGRLSLRARINSGTLYDAYGKAVDVTNGFTLKGYIIGGQREADFQFQPVDGAHRYAIYDTDLNGGTQLVRRSYWTTYDYILGLATAPDDPIFVAMELVNNGDAFQGADGTIPAGGTFYLVASMVPSEGENYQYGYLDQIFRKDFNTQVNLSVLNGWPDKDGDGIPDPDLDEHGNPKPLTGLATATYGVPDMLVPERTLGFSVDLRWKDGMEFHDIPL